MSLMRKHQARVIADRARGGSGSPAARVLGTMPPPKSGKVAANQLAALLSASLEGHLKALKDIPSIERKLDLKEKLVPEYREPVARLVSQGIVHDAVGYLLVWLMDTGAVEEGLDLAHKCIAMGQTLPERFNASLPLFVCSALIAWAEKEHKGGRSFEPYLSDTLLHVEDEADVWPVPDSTRAAFYRLLGLAAEAAEDWPVAVENFGRAFELGAKVETRLKNAAKKKDASEDSTGAEQPAG